MNSREVEERLNNMPRSEITKFLGELLINTHFR